ncbi:MAG: bifunctional (p)ppGpp synthetase/guanosine-3',5'-bis(diphosphate) 3'-pyrophosphohydrolase, partial [Dehalococcoidales bacterium]|nr:bifunctional (p)ppGpp synthetase/guanosine-3',5'-bis(diphosphate) 3'-pyrophosphohydrolase [Dehalococcoidales bacterium]
ARVFKFDDIDDFMAAVGDGSISNTQIAQQFDTRQETPKSEIPLAALKPARSGVWVLGAGDLATQIAQCCHPVPGDPIIGYITRSRGVTIHRQDCYNIIHEDEKERLVPVSWGETDSLYPVKIQVEGWDRVGLMRDISALVAEEKVNISSITLVSNDNHTVTLYFTLQTEGLAQLSRLLAKMESIKGITSVARVGDDATAKKS